MHVLILPSLYPNPYTPNAAPFCRDQAIALNKMGIKVGVIYPFQMDFWKIYPTYVKECLKKYKCMNDSGVITFISYGINIPKLSKYFLWNTTRKLLKQYIRINGRPDIIHSHFSFWSGWVAQKISNEFGVPYVITEHSSAFATRLYTRNKFLSIKSAFRNADALVSVSKSLSRSVQDTLDQVLDFNIVPNMVDTDFFSPSEKSKKDNKNILFFALGSLRPLKGFDFLIESFYKACRQNKFIELHIGGDGPEREKLEQMIKSYNMEEHIKLLGACNRDIILKKMHEADFFIHPSDYETFGVVIIEAMSCGLPVICTDGSGPEEYVKDFCGSIIEKRNVSQLTEEIINFSLRKDDFDRDKIREYIVHHFSSKRIAMKLINLYQKTLDRDE